MADYYNISNLSSATDAVDWIKFIQFDVSIPIAELMLLAIFSTSFLALKRYDNMQAFIASMFITTIGAGIFKIMKILNAEWLTISIALIVAAILSIIFFYER